MNPASRPAGPKARAARTFHVRFRARSESTGGARCALSFSGAGAQGRVEIRFSGVTSHDIPHLPELVLDGLELAADSDSPPLDASMTRRFRVESRGRCYRIEARSVQVHEHPPLYGAVLRLPRYGLRRRVLWTALLWIAGFDWGQRLIRRTRRSAGG